MIQPSSLSDWVRGGVDENSFVINHSSETASNCGSMTNIKSIRTKALDIAWIWGNFAADLNSLFHYTDNECMPYSSNI